VADIDPAVLTPPDAAFVQATADLLAAYVELSKVLPGSDLRGPAESALHMLLSPRLVVRAETSHVHGCPAIATGDPCDCTCLTYGMRRRG
jgi:hypothetical protein